MSEFNINNCPISTTDQPFANGSPEIVSPTCEEWQTGLTCESRNVLGKLNWFFNRITRCLNDLILRISALEGRVYLVDVIVNENTIIEVYSDDSTQVNDVSFYSSDLDTDTRLSNPRVTDPDNDGNSNITWDIIDALGNVIGIHTYEVLGDNGGSNPINLCGVPTATTAEINAANDVGYLVCLDGDLRRAGSLPVTCVPTNVKNVNATGTVYSRSDFSFVDNGAQSTASTAGPLDVALSMSNTSMTVFASTANRFRTAQTSSSAGDAILTFTFERPICTLILDLFDVDAPGENFISWSKTPDSVVPAFGNAVNSKVTITDINSTTVTVRTVNSVGAATSAFIDTVVECAPCVAGQRCTDAFGTVTLQDTNGNTLTNHIEC